MNRLKYILFLLLPFIIVSCDRPPDLTEVEINNILNEILATDSNFCIGQICWKYSDLEWTDEFKKEFSAADINFINRQKWLFRDLTIKPNTLKCYWPTRKRFDYPAIVDTNWKKGGVHYFAFPFISIDRTKVLINIEFKCNMPLCGNGSKDLYIKQNGKWKLVKSFDNWISHNNDQINNMPVTGFCFQWLGSGS